MENDHQDNGKFGNGDEDITYMLIANEVITHCDGLYSPSTKFNRL